MSRRSLGVANLTMLLLICGLVRLWLLRLERLDRIEFALEVADAQTLRVGLRVPIEGGFSCCHVLAVWPVNAVEDDGAVFHGAADGAELVHRPAEGHGSGAGHEAEGWAQASVSAACRRRGDRAQRL